MNVNESNHEPKQSIPSDSFFGFKLSENIAIAVIPLIAYSIIFAVESGYFYVFKLPSQFISFDLAEVFVVSSALLGLVFVVFAILNPLSDFFLSKNIPPVIVYKIHTYIPIVLLFLSAFVLFKSMWIEWVGFGVGLIFLLIGDFVFPIFTQSKNKNYLTKIARASELESRNIQKEISLLNKFIQMAGRNGAKVIFYFALTLYIAFQTGRSIALQKSDFWVVNTIPETVVLYIAKNQAVVAPFDRSTKEIEPEFMVID